MKKFLTSIVSLHLVVFSVYTQEQGARYYSQCGQDEYIHKNFFPTKTDGVYLEIGAHNGVRFSNTLFFEQRGWRGMCIEPIVEIFSQLCKNRNEKCICICAAIADFSGQAPFLYVKGACDMLSGLIHKYDPRHVNRIQYEGTANRCEFVQRMVDCIPLMVLLEKYGMFHIDYVSIDTEGGELDILKTIDYSKFDIDVITIEDNYGYPEIKTFLEEQGFALITSLEQGGGEQEHIFRNKKYLV